MFSFFFLKTVKGQNIRENMKKRKFLENLRKLTLFYSDRSGWAVLPGQWDWCRSEHCAPRPACQSGSRRDTNQRSETRGSRNNALPPVLTKQTKLYTATKIPFIYSFSGNSAASAPISTFMCLWAIYIVPGSVRDRSWKYINCSQTHECGNWDWGPDISFLGNICFEISVFCLRSVRYKPVFRIHNILVWIRIRGSMPLTNGSGSGTLLQTATPHFIWWKGKENGREVDSLWRLCSSI